MGARLNAIGSVIKDTAGVVKNVSWKDAEYVPAMIKGAAIGAGIGGATEWANGGSFWSGAKGGAFKGALAGGAYRVAKVGAGGAMDDYTKRNISDVSSHYSKALKAVMNEKAGKKMAEGFMNGSGI